MPSICHNTNRDVTAQLLTEVCPNVDVEPMLQSLSGERFHLRSANVEDSARLAIQAQNLWDKSSRQLSSRSEFLTSTPPPSSQQPLRHML